jgi:hypothetical protein
MGYNGLGLAKESFRRMRITTPAGPRSSPDSARAGAGNLIRARKANTAQLMHDGRLGVTPSPIADVQVALHLVFS